MASSPACSQRPSQALLRLKMKPLRQTAHFKVGWLTGLVEKNWMVYKMVQS